MNDSLSDEQVKEVSSWLVLSGYGSIEEWAEDSDYQKSEDEDGVEYWIDENGFPHYDMMVQAYWAMEAAKENNEQF